MGTQLSGRSFLDGKALTLEIFSGKIKSIQSNPSSPENRWIGPGFLDIQVNGYGGIDYNQLQQDILTLGQVSRSLLQVGVTSHFPTIITNSSDKVTSLIQQLVLLRQKDELSKSCISGIHIEGPFISPQDGPRGAHFREFVQSPDWNLFQKWIEAGEGLIRIITLSPEWEGSIQFIEKCVEANVLVSIGHTNASPTQIQDAVKAGARLSTHLGNGMHQTIQRHPNYLWSQLAAGQLSATIIADGFHLPVEVIQVFKKIKAEKLLLVSDAVALAGMPPGEYDAAVGGKVTLNEEGKLHLSGNSATLAGSAMNLLQGVNFLLKNELASLSEAWSMASVRPQILFNSDSEPFQLESEADLVVAEQQFDQTLKICKVFKNGNEISIS